MLTLSSCLIWEIISFIFPPNEYDCVYASTTLENIAKDRYRFWQKKDFGIKTLVWRQTKFNWFRIWSQLTIQCRRCRSNHLFRWSSFWSWRVCKQAKLSHLGHRKPAHLNNAGKYCSITFYDFGKEVIFSDEAHFDLAEYVNNPKNTLFWKML